MNDKILIAIPMYNCEYQIGRVIEQFDSKLRDFFSDILVIDNCSKDSSIEACKKAVNKISKFNVTIIRNHENYNLGGSHKVAFNYALDKQYDYVIILHGDDQGDIHDIIPFIQAKEHHQYDCLLGARFMRGAKLINYSVFRMFGNRFFNAIVSIICNQKIYDLGAGLNLYKTSFLQDRFYLRFTNTLAFNYCLLLYTINKSAILKFFPVSWREMDQVSNVKLLRQTKELLKIIFKYCLKKHQFINNMRSDQCAYSFDMIKI